MGAAPLHGRTIVVTGVAGPMGAACARALDAMGAAVIGVDAERAFAHCATFLRADLADPEAVDAVAAALPEGVAGLACLDWPEGAPGFLARALIAPRRLAAAVRLAPGGGVAVPGAPVHLWGDRARVRAAAALEAGDEAGFIARWGLAAEPAVVPALVRAGLAAWAMGAAARGLRVNAVAPGADPVAAGEAAAWLMAPLAGAVAGAVIAADGGAAARKMAVAEGI
jgi:hypothetical protein